MQSGARGRHGLRRFSAAGNAGALQRSRRIRARARSSDTRHGWQDRHEQLYRGGSALYGGAQHQTDADQLVRSAQGDY